MKKITADSFYQGKVKIYQHKKGYRFSLDSVLLASWVEKEGEYFLELGCGNGAASLMVAFRFPGILLAGLDLQFSLLKLFSLSIKDNSFDRVFPVLGDVRKLPFRGKFDVVFANPPYLSPAKGRVSPYPEVAISRFEIKATLRDFLLAASQQLKERGNAYFITGAERKEDFEKYCEQVGFSIVEEIFACPEKDRTPVFYLAKLSFDSTERKTFPPLVMKEGGVYTPQMERIFEGAGLREVI